MPLPERTFKNVDTTRSPTIATMEQFLRGTGGESSRRESSKLSPTYSPTSPSPSSPYFDRMKHHDPEEDLGLYQRKSVITKVKEKARKLRYSLSKRRQEEMNLTPSWGVSLEEEEEEEEEDAEYLGAPIYESELAPEEYKENARQHPRANPVISEKHVLRTAAKSGVEQDREKPLSPVKSTTTTTQPATTTTTGGPNMTMTGNVAQKLTPTNAEGSNAAHSASSKTHVISRTPSANVSSQSQTPSVSSLTPSISLPIQNPSISSSSSPLSRMNTSPKGASGKDYLMNKYEPRSYERTTSHGTSGAMSPRRSSSNVGVMERVKGAVNSLLRNEEPSSQQKYGVKTPTTRTSSQITTAQEVGQEENRGRILQAN